VDTAPTTRKRLNFNYQVEQDQLFSLGIGSAGRVGWHRRKGSATRLEVAVTDYLPFPARLLMGIWLKCARRKA
jgi:hypothetical protein